MAAEDGLDFGAMDVLDALGEGITIHDADGEMVAANRVAREILRLETSELLSRSYRDPAWEITDLDGRPLTPDELPAGRAIEEGSSVRDERIVVQRPDAPPVVLSVNAVPIRDEAGEVHRAVISFRDITDQREAEQRFERIFRDSPVGIALVSPEGRPVEVNRALAEMVGYDRSELREMTFPEFTHPEDVEKDVDRFRRLVEGEIDDYQIEKRYVTASGEVVWADLRLAAVRRPGDALPLAVAFVRNTTDRKRLEEELRQRTDRYERLLTEISDVVTLLAEDGTIRYESPSIEKVFGYAPEELVGRTAFELVHPDDADEVAEAFFAAVEGRPAMERTAQYRFRHADGSWRIVESTGVLPEDEELGPVIVTRDITDRARAQQKYRAIFSTNPSALALATLEEGELVEVNPSFQDLLGYAPGEAEGATVEELGLWARSEHRDLVWSRLRETGAVREEEAELRDADGQLVQVLLSASVLSIGNQEHVVLAAQDITERKEFEEALERQALHDPLTGLPNRTLLSDRLEQGLARARREGHPLGLLMLDVDQFKRINDRLGHTAGDRVLVELARRLRQAVREEDTVARWGGDEFFVVLPGLTEPEGILEVPERLRAAIQAPFAAGDEAVHLDLTMGAVVYSAAGHPEAVQTDDVEELIRFGSLALHWAREESATGFRLFHPGRDREVEGAAVIRQERELRDALKKGEIVPHFQPVVRLEDGELAGFEALARWRHPYRGLLPPSEFIPLAEELGLIGDVGEAIIRRGAREAGSWADPNTGGSPYPIGFNLSGQQFGDPELPRKLERWVVEAGLRPEQVTLEVTETSLMQVPARTEPLKEMGFEIFVDDFGTGHSTFTYLRDLDLDGLKVDMTFVQHIMDSPSDAALVETMLILGERLGLTVVAEGIETESQRRKLQTLGCEYGQGFLFARPAAVADLDVAGAESSGEEG